MFALLSAGNLWWLLAVVFLLLAARRFRELRRGMRTGIAEFRREMDNVAHAAGASVGGIYGKRANQALTPDNQVAELYDPEVLRRGKEERKRAKQGGWLRACLQWCRAMWRSIRVRLNFGRNE